MGVLLKQDISAVSFKHLQLQNLDGPVTLWGRQRMILDLLNIQPRQYLSVVQDDLFVKIKRQSLSIPDQLYKHFLPTVYRDRVPFIVDPLYPISEKSDGQQYCLIRLSYILFAPFFADRSYPSGITSVRS